MLTIGLAGGLASHLGSFRSVATATPIEWVGLGTDVSVRPNIDLVVYLADDVVSSGQLAAVAHAGQPGRLASRWETVPDRDGLDDAIQMSLREVYGFIVGYSAAMHDACRWIRAAAHPTTAALSLRTLILGETGTGKELISESIHKLSSRRNEPFVAVNCAAMAPPLIHSDLFGHRRGAFSDAIADRAGAFRSAGQGTIFLDEIGDLPLALQTVLLRVLEQSRFTPVGSDVPESLQAQVILATNHQLDEAVKLGTFRADLYFRINQISIPLAPLRLRREDIPLLSRFFLNAHGLSPNMIDQPTRDLMLNYDWPGNVRELRLAVDRIALLLRSHGSVEPSSWLPAGVPVSTRVSTAAQTLAERRDEFDRRVLAEVLARCGSDTRRTAAELGISRRSVYNLAKRLGIPLGKEQPD